jgi:hypothetical protein
VRAGRFERSLSTLTAAGALVTAAAIYFEHDSAASATPTGACCQLRAVPNPALTIMAIAARAADRLIAGARSGPG